MLLLISVVSLLVAHVHGDNFRGSPRVWRRDGSLGNSTGSYINSTIPTTTYLTSLSSSTLTTATISSTSSNETSVTDQSPTLLPTQILNTTPTTPEPTCLGSVTYTGSVYPTVFVTVTEGFNVTVTASNASLTESATLITPLPACEATIVSAGASIAPLGGPLATPIETIAISTLSFEILSPAAPTGPSSTSEGTAQGSSNPHPGPELNSSEGEPPAPEATLPAESESVSTLYSTLYASAPYTSTVVITKKTPVPVVVPTTSAPPNFQTSTSSPKPPLTPGTTHQNNPGNGGSTKPAANTLKPTNNGPAPAALPTPLVLTVPGAATGPARTIASAVNTPFAPAQPDVVAPATTINNVPIGVGASSVLVGTQAVAIPTSGAATIRASGQLFTLKPSELIASGTTIGLGSLELARIASTIAPTLVTAAPGLVLTVQGTTVVIAGTTYRIGAGASPTVLTVSGQRIQLGPSGVVLASTTVPAGAVTPAPMVVESVGRLTFSVDASEVVVDGTTYRIGSGAPTINTIVDGQSLSIGPGGVGVGGKTTLKPTSVSADRTGTSTATGAAGVQTAAATYNAQIPPTELFGLLMAIGGLLA